MTEEPRTALELPLDDDISALSDALYRLRIPHRVYEQRGRQVLEVLRGGDVEVVQAAYRTWRAQGAAPRSARAGGGLREAGAGIVHACRRVPAVAGVVALAVLLFPVGWSMQDDSLGSLLPWLTIVPVEVAGDRLRAGTLADVLAAGQIWRLFTPAWLHFSFAHLAFNVALVVYFGRRIELGAGSLVFVGCVATIALVSDVSQYVASGTPLFGGLSGVAYGLFGFVVVRSRQRPGDAVWRLPTGLVVAMLLSLAVMASGITEPFGLAIANAAHVAGLVCGAICALVFRPNLRRLT